MKTIRFSLALSTLILFSGAVYAKNDPLYQEGEQIGSYLIRYKEVGIGGQKRPAFPQTLNLLRTFISHDPLSKEFKGAFGGLKNLSRGIKQHLLDHSDNTSLPVEKVAHSLDLILEADNIGEVLHSAGQKISALAKTTPLLKRPIPVPLPRDINTQSKLYTDGRKFSTTLCKLLAACGQSQGLSLTKIMLAAQLSQQTATFRNIKPNGSSSLLPDIANAFGGFKEGLQDFPLSETLKSSPKPFNASIVRCIYTLLLTWTEAPDHLTDGTAYKAVDTIGQTLTTCGKEIEALYR